MPEPAYDETDFVELNILLAVMNEDEDRARELIEDCTDHELTVLYRHLGRAQTLIWNQQEAREVRQAERTYLPRHRRQAGGT